MHKLSAWGDIGRYLHSDYSIPQHGEKQIFRGAGQPTQRRHHQYTFSTRQPSRQASHLTKEEPKGASPGSDKHYYIVSAAHLHLQISAEMENSNCGKTACHHYQPCMFAHIFPLDTGFIAQKSTGITVHYKSDRLSSWEPLNCTRFLIGSVCSIKQTHSHHTTMLQS